MDARTAALSESLEDYLEAILELTRAHGHAHVNDIAIRRGVKKSSANCALRTLQKKGLVDYEKYQPVLLTKKGAAIALSILGKHEALTRFFIEKLDLKPDAAKEVACKLEHVLDEGTLSKLVGLFRKAGKGPGRKACCGAAAAVCAKKDKPD